MRIVVVGASGNAGTALLRRLRREPDVEIAGVSRRPPGQAGRPVDEPYDMVDWHACDIGLSGAADRLEKIFTGADAVVHLAWQIQPSHDQAVLRRTNFDGSRAVVQATIAAGVPALVYASSVGTYAPGPKDRFVDETWPTTGVPGSAYSRDKADVERLLDEAESEQPALRVVRLRPGLMFQRDAGTEITRYFVGPFVPVSLLRFGRLPLVPNHPGLRVQAVHTDDAADAYARAILGDARGAFNVAAEPVLTPQLIASAFHGRTVPVPGALLRAGADLTWRARLQPVDRGWVDLGLHAPLMATGRAERELGWRPTVDALAALRELFDGMARGGHAASPPMSGTGWLAGRLGGLLRGRPPGHGNPY
jgi:nucleoside-diphosphate-sugar epimerase